MEQLRFDIVIIGMGLGAAAIAYKVASTGASIAMVPGVGRSRFRHMDGGIMDARLLESVFGTSDDAPIFPADEHATFRRDQLEAWAIERVHQYVTIINDFEDLSLLPHDAGQLSLHEESGKRELIARLVILTEGASPKIGIAARIRSDFEPEDLIHFGRVILPDITIKAPVASQWRTSWNMPAWYSIIPHPDGVIVSASARIENIMRVSMDGREVLKDFFQSHAARDLGLPTSADSIGMELVSLRSHGQAGKIGAHNIVISPDANGTIDARSLQRFTLTLQSGAELGDLITTVWPTIPEWDEPVTAIGSVFTTNRTPYHDSSETGFIEEGSGPPTGLLRKLFKR